MCTEKEGGNSIELYDGLVPDPILAKAKKVFSLRSRRLNTDLNLHSRRYDIGSTAVIAALAGATLATTAV